MNTVLPVDKKCRALLFDFDGLLVNSEEIWEVVEREIIRNHGGEYDPDIIHKYIGTGLLVWSEAIVREYQFPIAPELFLEELLSMIIPALAEHAQPMPGAVATITTAKAMGVPIAIASSSPRMLVEPVVRKLGWDVAIPVRCTGDEVAHAKPAPDVYLLAAERLGVAPSDCLVLEDSVNGARAATAAGMHCIAVPNPAYSDAHFEGITVAVIPSLTELDLSLWLE